MRVEPKALFKRLTPTATRYVELAAGKAVGAQHYEIDVEHVLLAMLSDAEGECAQILKHFRQNRAQWVSEVERGLSGMRAGNPKRPAISDNLFQWLEDAWLCASVDLGEIRLRSGVLLYQALLRPGRYASDALSELSDIEPDAFKKFLAESASSSAESLEAVPSWDAAGAAGAGGAAAAPGGDGALARFTHDFTQAARDGKIDPIFGRHREIRQMVDILSRRRKNNPIIVGEPGVGKTALVEGLALEIVQGDVPEHLRNVKLMALDMGALQAGASVKGEFENRLKAVITEVKASPTPVVLFIDEAHTLIGAGGPQGGSDAANLLKPALARGELRTVAATTWAEYKKYFEKDAALERRFQMVKVEEPSEADAIVMIRGLRAVYEKAHGVAIREDAVVAAVELSHRYISGRQLPDKAVDLLDTSAARVRVERAAKPEELVGLTLTLAALSRQRDAQQRDLDDGDTGLSEDLAQTVAEIADVSARVEVLEAKWQSEMKALQLVVDARKAVDTALAAATAPAPEELAKLRAAAKTASDELAAVGGEDRLVHIDVDADAVGRTVSSWTGIPVGRMKRDAAAAVLGLETALKSRVIGQDHAMQTLSEIIRISHAGIRDPNAPVGVLLFVGPSGVGKTETALALADELYGGERFMTTIAMSEFQEKHTVSRLIGSPPGYVGYGEGGLLTEAVRQRPYSVVLLDECEKADLEVMNLFYQVFDKGTLTDGEGRLIDFRNTLIILTSNLASDRVMSCFADGKRPSAEEVTTSIRPVLSKHFQPALLARMSIVPYAPIASEAMAGIASLKLAKLARRVQEAHGVVTRFAPELVASIAQRCTEAETGARNIDHILRGSLMPALASALLSRMAELDALSTLEVALDPRGEWTFSFA